MLLMPKCTEQLCYKLSVGLFDVERVLKSASMLHIVGMTLPVYRINRIVFIRWWPGQICRPQLIPLNIRDLPHDIGQFAVYFFGTRDYLWTHHGR